MFVVTVEFRVHAQHAAAFHQAITDNARLSVELEPGCHQFDVCCDAAEPGYFFLYEIYDDAAAFQLHLQSAHFLQMNAQTASWVVSKAVRTLHRVQP
jgi:(4S)-4-hydroxy-5-phosphonooxypentane-2,3-dione isomerase